MIHHLIARLEEIRDLKGKDPHLAICGYLEVYDLRELFLELTAKYWPKFSGDYHYPIPLAEPDRFKSGKDEFYNCVSLWRGKRGKLRYELLDFIIENGVELFHKLEKLQLIDNKVKSYVMV